MRRTLLNTGMMAAVVLLSNLMALAETPLFEDGQSKIRHIYVPIETLDAVTAQERFGAILSKAEYNKLLKEAQQQADVLAHQPKQPLITNAQYNGQLNGERLELEVAVEIQTFSKGWNELHLGVQGLSIEAAQLNGKPAIATQANDGQRLRLLIDAQQPAKHELKLNCSIPLRAVASDKVVGFGLIGNSSGTLSIEVPANKFLEVEGLAGPKQQQRLSFDRPEDVEKPATYEIPIGGKQNVNLLFTERRDAERSDLLTFASTAYGISVQPSEITWTARTNLQVFGQAIDRVVATIPNSLEITGVESTGLESWELADAPNEADHTQITLNYRQSFTGMRTVTFRGILSDTPDETWSVPALRLNDVVSHTGVIVVSHPANVRVRSIEEQGVRLQPGTDGVRYQVWEEDFKLSLLAALKDRQVNAAMTNILDINDQGLSLFCTVSFEARRTPLFDARVRLPAGWQIMSALVENQPAEWELIPLDAGVNELRVKLNPPLAPESTRTLSLVAVMQPENWPVASDSVLIALPETRLPQASMVEALYGVTIDEDLDVIPVDVTGLDPARQADINLLNQNLGERQVRLGFTYQDTVFSGKLEVRRKPTLLEAETLTFFRIDEETLFTRLEARINSLGGGLRTINVQVSEAAGTELRFRLIPVDGPLVNIVDQTPGDAANGMVPWTLSLDQYLQGRYVLYVEKTLDRGEAPYSPLHMSLPQSLIQSGYIAIEGSSEEHLAITAQDQAEEPLAVVDPVDFPEARYAPQKRIVAGFRHVRPGWKVEVTSQKFDRSAIPTAIGHRADLTSVLGKAGEFQHKATVLFTAFGTQSLLVQLPPEATLWSTLLNETPIEVRKTDAGIQIPLAGTDEASQQRLDLLYSTPVPAIQGMVRIQAQPPIISVVDGKGAEQPLEILDRNWTLHYPEESQLVQSQGLFQPTSVAEGTILDRLREYIEVPTLEGAGERGVFVLVAFVVLWLLSRVWTTFTSRWSWAGGLLFVALLVPVGLFAGFMMLWSAGLSKAPEKSVANEYYDFSEQVSEDSIGTAGDILSVAPSGGEMQAEEQLDSLFADTESRKAGNDPFGEAARKIRPEPTSEPAPPMEAPDAAKPLDNFRRQPSRPSLAKELDAKLGEQLEREEMQKNRADDMAPKLDEAITLQIQQNQTQDNPFLPAIQDEEQAKRDSTLGFSARGALLSMTFDLQLPDGTRTEEFVYHGNGVRDDQIDLNIQLANRESRNLLLWTIAWAVALIGWWLRAVSRKLRAFYIFIAFIIPLGLLAILPALTHVILEGLLFGGLLTIFGWLVRACVQCCQTRCRCVWDWCCSKSNATALLLIALLGTQTLAEDKQVPPIPPVPEREPFVVMTYETLADLPESERVWVPHETYVKLWNLAHPEELNPETAPEASVLAEANYDAKLVQVGDQQQIEIQARWVVVNLYPKTQTLLPIAGRMAVSKLKIDGEPGTVTASPAGTSVVTSGRGPHVIDATLNVPADVVGAAGEFSVELKPVPAGLLRLTLSQQRENTEVRVNGSTGLYRRTQQGEDLVIAVPINSGGRLDLSWRPQQEQTRDQFILVQSSTEAGIDDVGVHTNSGYAIQVQQGALNDISFALPMGTTVRSIQGEDVGGWEQIAENMETTLRVFFRREITESTKLRIDLFQPLKLNGDDSQELNVQFPKPLNSNRVVGQVVLSAVDHLNVRVGAAQGLSQIDLNAFKPVMELGSVGTRRFAYRFNEPKFELRASVARRPAESTANVQHGVQLDRRKVLIASLLKLNLTGEPRRSIRIQLPTDYLTIDVACPMAVDWFVASDGDDSFLEIELDQPRTGQVEISLEGHITKTPQDDPVSISLPQVMNVTRQTNTLGVWFDEAYEAAAADTSGWKELTVQALPQEIKRLQSKAVQFAYRSDETELSPVRFSVQQAVPELTVDAVTVIAVSDDTVDYGLTARWSITRAATDEFLLITPAWLGNLDFQGPGIRQVQSETLDDGRLQWRISLIDPVRQQYLVTAAATVALPEDQKVLAPVLEFQKLTPVGDVTPITVQRQFALPVNLSGYQLVSAHSEDVPVVSIDAVPLKVHKELAQQAMEVVRVQPESTTTWTIEKVETLGGTQAVVVASHLQTVLELDGSWRTQAKYGIRNRGRQFLALALPEESRILSVFVRGEASRTVTTLLDGKTIHLIALPQTSAADLSFDVDVIVEGRLAQQLPSGFSLQAREVSLPAPRVISDQESEDYGLPVAQTLWTVHSPDDVDVQVVRGQGSNVTSHASHQFLAAETQELERISNDIAEMKRVLKSTNKFSRTQRVQAQNNLKQLGLALEQQIQAVQQKESAKYFSEEEAEELVRKNRDLQGDISQTEVDTNGDGAVEFSDEFYNAGRGFIISNNSAIVEGNTLQRQELSTGKDAALNFSNSYDLGGKQSMTKGSFESGAEKKAVDRSRLKRQLETQQQFNAPNQSNAGNGVPQSSLWGMRVHPPQQQMGQNGAAINGLNDQQGIQLDAGGFAGGGGFGGRAPSLPDYTIRNATDYTVGDVDGININITHEPGIAMPKPAATWQASGGLSVEMDIPINGDEAAFSKVGGDPKLTLSIRPRTTRSLAMGSIWCIGIVVVGLMVMRQFSGDVSWRGVVQAIAILGLGIGLAGFFLLPVALKWGFFLIFCLGGLVRVVTPISAEA